MRASSTSYSFRLVMILLVILLSESTIRLIYGRETKIDGSFLVAKAVLPPNETELSHSFQCPSEQVYTPCKCFTWDPSPPERNDTEVEISCRTLKTDEFSLKSLFSRISDHISLTNGITRFEALRLEHTAIGEITDREMFGNISFKSLDLFNNLDLNYIDLSVFNSSTSTLETFCVQGSPLTDEDGKFLSQITQFPKLETLILSNNELLGLNDFTFGTNSQQNLSYIDLSGNNLTKIGKRAFHKLPELHRLNLDYNQIDHISNETFTFEVEESKLLLLFLRHNNLTGESFEPNSFTNLDKTVFLYLNNNQIRYLDEVVFKPMLDAKSDLFIALWSNPFQCDCRAKWLLEDPSYYKKRVHGVRCPDKRELWDMDEDDLKC